MKAKGRENPPDEAFEKSRSDVSSSQEGLERSNLACRGFDSELLEKMTKSGASRMTADGHPVSSADETGVKRFVRPKVPKKSVTVNSGFMCKTQIADNRSIRGHGSARSNGCHPAEGEQTAWVHAAAKRRMQQEDHDHLFQRRIACPLSETVDRDAEGFSSGFDCRQGIGRGQSEIVVTMEFHRQTGGCLTTHGNRPSNRIGSCHPYGIRQAQTMNACMGRRLDELKQEFLIRPGSILGADADMGEMGIRQGYHLLHLMENPEAILSQGLEKNVRYRKADMYSGDPASNGGRHIFGTGPAPYAQAASKSQVLDANDVCLLGGSHDRGAHFHLVDADSIQSASDGKLVFGVEDDACRLNAVPQSRIVKMNVFTGSAWIHIPQPIVNIDRPPSDCFLRRQIMRVGRQPIWW